MSYNIRTIPSFDRELKMLSKKHRSIKIDISELGVLLLENPKMGDEIIENCFKIRMAISSKGNGKSGGARVITYVYIHSETVYLLSIYDKSNKENISDALLKELIKNLDLENPDQLTSDNNQNI
jgi:mRNA-degrading endonuclease RelE of RelBE toxin-antitoxin system